MSKIVSAAGEDSVSAEQIAPVVSLNGEVQDICPRPPRRRRRAAEDRGLPPDDEIARFAQAYLEFQRKHWPEIVAAGLLPEVTPASIEAMVDDFKKRHRTGIADVNAVKHFVKYCQELGGDYSRYSCDNSSPMSIVDQASNALKKARSENRFIP